MTLFKKLMSEAWLSLVLILVATLIWHVIMPLLFLDRLLFLMRNPSSYGDLLTVIVIFLTYYLALSITMFFAEKVKLGVNAIRIAYFGGWWMIILYTIFSVYNPAFLDLFGIKLENSGAFLIFLTLFVGVAKQILKVIKDSKEQAEINYTPPPPVSDNPANEG
jgi:hypothetical protein